MKKTKYYAYFIPGRSQGVTDNWPDCEKMVKGTRDARYRSFPNREDAQAWLRGGARYEDKGKKIAPKIQKGIYFDSGTGRGKGVEVSVTDEKGKDLLGEILPKSKINKFGKHSVKDATNNFGELLAAKLALELALKKKSPRVLGDSKLIVNFWSKGFAKLEDLPARTAKLIEEVAGLRHDYEEKGGVVEFIPGDYNPADLGFHR
jgi:ribonuclease H-related protein